MNHGHFDSPRIFPSSPLSSLFFFSDVSPNTRVQVLGFPFDLLYIDMIASVDFLMGGYGYKLFALAV